MSALDAPMKTLNTGALAAGGRRFRFVPLRERLRAASARPAALPPLAPPSSAAAEDTHFTHFADALAARRELDLTAAFIDYADAVAPLALSLPLVFTARERIVAETLAALTPGTPAAHSIAECLCAVARDLGAEHFYPFLPDVVRTLARLFGGDAGAAVPRAHDADGDLELADDAEGDDAATGAAAAAAQLWDPERTLVPAFAALARIVKLLVQPLLRAPDATIAALAPLLAHPHYRVREMAAEASAGYLLRKTRDAVALRALCDAVLGLPNVASGVVVGRNPAVDGTAAVLYEGTRAIRGGLHPFAEQIWAHVVEAVVGCDSREPRFVAVANALAAVRQNTSSVDAIAGISFCLLRCADNAAMEVAEEASDAGQQTVGNALFLLRCWCAHRTGAWMKEAHQQRALDIAVSVTAASAASGERATCEALGIISAVLTALSVSSSGVRYRALNKSARASLVSATRNVPEGLTCVALHTLRVAYEARAVSARDILPTYAALCDRVADNEDQAALEHALLLLRQLSLPSSERVSLVPARLVDFEAPRLCAAVLRLITGDADTLRSSQMTSLVLEFCRWARVAGSSHALTAIVESWKRCEPGAPVTASERSTCALALDSLVAQYLLESRGPVWDEGAQKLLETSTRMLVELPDQLGPIRALNRLLSFPVPLRCSIRVDELVIATAKSVSSGSRETRCQASFLLTQIAAAEESASKPQAMGPGRGIASSDSDEDEDDKKHSAAEIFVRLETKLSLSTVFEAVWRINSAPLTVDESAATRQLVLALAGIPQRNNGLGKAKCVLTVLAHAAVGLFRTKFKLLWKGAGELWCCVAAEDSEVAWSPMRHALLSSRDEILESCARRTDAVEDVEDEEEELQDVDSEECGSSAVNADDADTMEEVRPGSKRKRPGGAGTNLSVVRDYAADEADDDGAELNVPPTPLKRARRSQAKGVISLRWTTGSWQQKIEDAQKTVVRSSILTILRNEGVDDSTDAVTMHRELLVAVGKNPTVAHGARPFIIQDLYLRLDSELMSRRLANSLVRVYSDLLERLGGLKGTGNDTALERKMRARLMKDLCRPEAPCQTAVVKCLAASRSPEIRAHRESLLRLIDDSSFRDELTVLSTKLRESVDGESTRTSAQDNGLQDVLVRICFGKMRGRRDRLGSRRGAVLGFIVATLSWSEAIPRLIGLALLPIGDAVSDLVKAMQTSPGFGNDSQDLTVAAPTNVLRGILRSMEAIVQQFGVAIPVDSWRRLACAACVMLEATNHSPAKTIRALTLRRLAAMLEKRPQETEFIIRRVVAAVRRGRFDSGNANDVTDAPGFLVLLAACARAPLPFLHRELAKHEAWAFTWSLGVVAGSRGRSNAVELALEVARIVVQQVATELGAAVKEGEGDSKLDQELVAYVPVALQKRLAIFQDLMARDGKLGRWRAVLEQAMNIVAVLGDCGLADEQATSLVSSLSSFVVADAGRCQDATKGTLVALGGLFRHLCRKDRPTQTAAFCANREEFISSNAMSLSRLFNDKFVASHSEERDALCRALHSLDRPDLLIVADILLDMGAMRQDRVNEADYDVRLLSLSKVCKAAKSALEGRCEIRFALNAASSVDANESTGLVAIEEDGLCALMRGCLWALKDDDSASRGTAGYALTLLAQWTTSVAEVPELADRCVQFAEEMLPALTCAAAMAPAIAERREACGALGAFLRVSLLKKSPEASNLQTGLLELVRPDNMDLDFFENVAHLQPHRRSRALRQLATLLNPTTKPAEDDRKNVRTLSSVASRELSTEFALPLAYRIALDVSEASEKKSKHAKSMESRDAVRADVILWASEACGAAARHIAHDEYRMTLSRVIRRLPREDNETRLQSLYSLLVSIVDSFPLNEDGSACTPEMAVFLSKTTLPQMLKHVTAGAVEGDILTSVLAGHTKRGQGGIGSGNAAARTGMVFRAPVAVAAARLMTRMPAGEMEVVLPLLITPVASALRSRMNDVRESAKKALVRLVVMLGAKYLPYVVRQVLQVLEKGYRKDAGVYVLHALLMGIRAARKGTENGSSAEKGRSESEEKQLYMPVGSAAGIIADALVAELVEGTSTNAKDFDNPNVSSSRARDAANRATRAADAAELLGELICFDTSVARTVKPFFDAIELTASSKLAARLETAMQHLCLGLVRNVSLEPSDALRFAYATVHDHMPLPTVSGADDEKKPPAAETESRVFCTLPRAHAVAEFGLFFLNSLLGKSIVKADGSDDSCRKLQRMLEPFLPELALALKSRFDSLTLVALKVTQRLVRLPLAGRTSVADDMTGTVLSVLSRRGAAKSHNQATSTNGQDLFQTCLRAASVIVHELGKGDDGGDDVDSIREDSVRQLLVIARESLGEGSVEMRNAALAFIRSAVAARFKTPEIYDAVDDVSRLAVRGQSANLQSTCIAISVAFLVNYPLSAKRIRQQLEFYVRNLNYKHPDGRLAALRALHTVVAKFPVPSVNAEAEFMFLPLAAVIANDEELSCRQEASETIKMLLSRVSDSRKIADMLGMTTTLLGVKEKDGANFGFEVCGGGNASLQKAGASILGVAVGSGSLSKPQILSALFSNLTVVLHGSGPDSRQAWEVTHAALSSTELAFDALALLGEAARAELSSDLAPFWNLMPALLQQQHLWVRGVSCRLLGRHFAALGADCMCHGGQSRQYSLFNGPLGSVRDLIKSLCLVLESSVLSESLAEQTLKNLLYIGNCLRLHPAVGEAGLSTTLDDDDDLERDGVVEDGAGESRKESEREPNRGLYWLLRRLSGMAIRSGQSDSALLRRACAVRFLAAAVASWGVTSIKPYLRLFISPVVRVVDRKADLIARNGPVSAAAEAAAAAIVAMAEATQEMLVKELGADEYYVIYNELKAQRRAEQNERKRKHAVEAAIDPERAAKKRIKRSAAKSRARRRKTSEGQGRGQAWRVAHSTYAADGRDLNPLRDD